MIQMYHVYKQYPPNIQALLDVTLFVEKGEFVFLTGHSGAGKSTLLRLITRAELPNTGQIVVAGRNVLSLFRTEDPLFPAADRRGLPGHQAHPPENPF